MRVAFERRRDLIVELFKAIPGMRVNVPDGAFYLFVHAPGDDSAAFSEYAKTHFNLLIVPGDSFGCPSYFRLSYCVDYDMIERSLPAFKALLEEYRPGKK